MAGETCIAGASERQVYFDMGHKVYKLLDTDGDALVDATETICLGDHDQSLGGGEAVLKKLLAGYSRSSQVSPDVENDKTFALFVGILAPALYTKYLPQIRAAQADHKANAARDLTHFVTDEVIEVALTLEMQSRGQQKTLIKPEDWSEQRLANHIAYRFNAAKDEGVDTQVMRSTLVSSLEAVKTRLIHQQELDRTDRTFFLEFLGGLITQYQSPDPSASVPPA